MNRIPSKGMSEDATPPVGSSTTRSDPLRDELTAAADRIDAPAWSKLVPPVMARIPEIRVGRRWFSTLWIVLLGAVVLVVGVAVAQQLRTYPAVGQFIETHPGTGAFQPPVDTGFPTWLRLLHFLNLLFMTFIIRSGLQILAEHPRLQTDAGSEPGREWLRLRGPVPAHRMVQSPAEQAWTARDDTVTLPSWLGLPGVRHSIGLARWWHLGVDMLWVVLGVVFYVLLFSTGQWERLVPRDWDVFPNALSAGLQYLSLDFPTNKGWTQYNGLQTLAYFTTVFIAGPLAIVTGLLQAPAVAARFGFAAGLLNRQMARSLHFMVLLYFVVFILVHVALVFMTGLLANLNHITVGRDAAAWTGFWVFLLGMAVVVTAWCVASPMTLRHPRLVQRIGRRLVGGATFLLEWSDPRATYSEKDISPYFWPNGTLPTSQYYRDLQDNGFRDYTLRIDGLVENAVTLTYEQLKAIPRQDQITQHYCIQGWSGIAMWGGVPMKRIVELVRPMPQAKWVIFYSFADGPEGGRYYDAHKVSHMQHPLTLLAYQMNGEPLNELHGAPLRLRNERELGFKQVKWVEAVEFVDSFAHLGAGQGGYNEDHEFYDYRDPI